MAGPVEVTVWYDGDCPLCRNEIAVLRALDGGGSGPRKPGHGDRGRDRART